jgi:transposase
MEELRMNYNQNERILQVTEKTLIIGVDIASEIQYARCFDYRGIELGKTLKFNNDIDGFEQFTAWSKTIQWKNKKTDVIVGMEPTGHYWFNLAQYLKDDNMKVVLVNPFHVNRSKELDDNNPTKNDQKDPKTIAMLVKDGRYIEPYIPEGIYKELRTTMDTRWQIVKQVNSIRNRVKRWLNIYFPEFNTVFGDWEGKAALIVLKEFATPSKVVALGADGIVSRWRLDKLRAVGQKRAIALVEAARKSVGIREGLVSATNDLEIMLANYELHMSHYDKTMALAESLAQQIPGMEEILKIKGVGLVTAAGFMAEVGDMSRFEHPSQIQKLAGLNLKETSSGKHKGKTSISKRGRSRLRALLFQGIMPLVASNPEFKELHAYYTNRTLNPLKKKQSLVLLGCKLIRIFFALVNKRVPYDGQKLMTDIKRQTQLKEQVA